MIHKKPLLGLIGLLAAGMVGQAAPAWANVYASGLNKTGDKTLSYVLNENASAGVSVQVWETGGGVVYSENLGSQNKGAHSWTWNGTGGKGGKSYTVKVVASSSGYSAWTKTSTDGGLTNFFAPKGVAVNQNQNSQYFGRVYVSNGAAGTSTRATQDGIYMLNADLSDAIGQGNTAKAGGMTWSTATANTPYRIEVGPDNKVYVCGYGDAQSGLWMADADFSSAKAVLDNTGANGSGLNATHGSISGFVVEGTGASRKIYTMDEDFGASIGNILYYNIGNSSVFTGAPSGKLYDDTAAGDRIANANDDIIHAKDGTWWVSQVRTGNAGDTLMSLMQISADGKSVLWSSVSKLAADASTDPLRRAIGIGYDSLHDLIAVTTYDSGKVLLFNATSKTIVSTLTPSTTTSVSTGDVTFDAAGNVYVVDAFNHQLWTYSPSGANSYTTQSWFSFTNPVPEPASIVALLVGLPGLYLVRRRKR